jgi:Na+-transporting NADH:ubiquinone oxidoreductase subunit B
LTIQTSPYVRSGNSIGRIRGLRLIAIFPVIIAAVINTGYQYLIALQATTDHSADGWRDSLAQYFNVGYAEPGAYDIILAGLVQVMPVFAIAFLTSSFWERVFSENRNRPFDIGVLYTALLFTMLMPPGAALFHVIFGLSFAMIFAHGIFGGEGRAFLNPALVAVAVVQITFPSALTNHVLWTRLNGYAGTRDLTIYHQQGIDGSVWTDFSWWDAFLGNTQGLMGTTSVLAVLIGASILLYGSIASWRLLAGQLIGVIAIVTICNFLGGGILDMPWYWHVVLGGFAFTAVFIATDPSSSAATDAGRWIQGILAGALVVFMRVVNPSHPDGVIPVLLLVSMSAPLIDHVVIWFNIRRRARSYGDSHG